VTAIPLSSKCKEGPHKVHLTPRVAQMRWHLGSDAAYFRGVRVQHFGVISEQNERAVSSPSHTHTSRATSALLPSTPRSLRNATVTGAPPDAETLSLVFRQAPRVDFMCRLGDNDCYHGLRYTVQITRGAQLTRIAQGAHGGWRAGGRGLGLEWRVGV